MHEQVVRCFHLFLLTELAPELTADVKNASQILLPVSDEIEGVTMEFVDDLDSDAIPISQLETLLIEMEGMKTTHLGYIHIFPSAQCTNKPVQTDITQSGDDTLVHEFKQKTTRQKQVNLTEGDACLQSDISDTNQLTETSRSYVQSVSTISVETNKEVYDNNNKTSGAGSLCTLVSAETQTDPMQPPLESYVHPPQVGEQKLRSSSDTDNTPVSSVGSIDKPLTKHSDVSVDEDVALYTAPGAADVYDESDDDSFESLSEDSKHPEAPKKQHREGAMQYDELLDDIDEVTEDIIQRKASDKIFTTTETTIFTDTDQVRRNREKDEDRDLSRDDNVNEISEKGLLVKEPSFLPKQGVLSQTDTISLIEKSSQSYHNVNQENQTDEIKISEKSSEMEQVKSRPTQTDAIVTSRRETQSPVTTHTLSQTDEIFNEERQSQTERLPAGDRDSQTEGVTYGSTDSQTDDVHVGSKYSQTTKITTGNRPSQTEVTSSSDVDAQTEPVLQDHQNTQTEPLIDETVPLEVAPGSRAPPGKKKVDLSECDTQTDLTEKMLLAILSSTSQVHSSSKSLAEGIFYDNSGYVIQNQSQDQPGAAAAATSRKYGNTHFTASPSGVKESSEFRNGHKGSKGELSLKTQLASGRHESDQQLDVSLDCSPEGNMQFPDFLDGPGEYGAETGAVGNVREEVQPSASGNGEGFLPDLVTPDDRLLSGMPDGAEGEDIDGKVDENDEPQCDALGQQQGITTRKSSSKGKLQHRIGTKKSPKSSQKGTGFVSEVSSGGDRILLAGKASTGKITIGSEGEGEEESAKPSRESEISSLTTETDIALRMKRKGKPPVIIRYAEEEKVGDWCTCFFRCCLPPYVLFLLLLALACLLPLTEPDISCCFENHYPSTFGIKMTYPNGPPPI